MFLSYAVMPAFVFIVLLNFFYLNYPVHSKENVIFSGNCTECLKSGCHKQKRACTTLDHTTYHCFTCDGDSDGFEQFYTKGRCELHCQDKKDYVCACDGACIKCLPHSKAKGLGGCGQLPADKADGNCKSVPYNGKPNEGPDTKGSDSKNPPDGGYSNTGSNGKSPKTPPGGSGDKNGKSTDTGSTNTGTSDDDSNAGDTLIIFGDDSQGSQKPKTPLPAGVHTLSANV